MRVMIDLNGKRILVTNCSPATHRFLARVEKSGPVHPIYGRCWVWTGGRQKGYGRFRLEGKQRVGAHRFSYELYVGSVPDGLYVLHKCDNKLCVNPDHLFLGTQEDNQADKVDKDRQAKGINNGRAVLTEEQVLEIRRRMRPYGGCNSRAALSREFGISENAISRIMLRKVWKHL